MTGVRIIPVSKDDDGQRFDRWIKRHAPDLPFVLVQKLIRKGQIRVDGKRAKTDTRLEAGQEVRLPPYSGEAEGRSPRVKPGPSEEDAKFIRGLVVYDDGEVIAINKPQGLAVQGGTGTKRHIDGMLDALKDKDGVKPRLVHRLDRDTSGILLLARSAKIATLLGDMFKSRAIRKIYWAIVTPVPEVFDGTIKAPVIKAGGAAREKMVVDDEDGKYALTEYRVIEQAAGAAAFVAFWPRTGRTHQIRVHARVMGCSVLGDGKYGGASAFIEGLPHSRKLHLHAQRLICKHPTRKGQILDLSAPLPKELAESWKSLGFQTSLRSDPFADVKL